MRKCLIAFVIAAVAGILPAAAQNNNGKPTGGPQGFDEFRKKVLGDYQDFRKGILAEYDKYLDGIWKEVEEFHEKAWDEEPKPKEPPVVKTPPKEPEKPVEKPVQQETPPPPVAPEINDPTIEDPDVYVDIPQMNPLDIPSVNIPLMKVKEKHLQIPFYCMNLEFPIIQVEGFRAAAQQRDYGKMWRNYADAKLAEKIVPYLQEYAKQYGLSDWFVYEMTRAYCDTVLKDFPREGRISMAHYLLLHLGYNARIAKRGEDKPLLLMAFRQPVYARTFVRMGPITYHIFNDNVDPPAESKEGITSCELPDDAELGAVMDLKIHKPLNIPYEPHKFEVTFKGYTLKGEVNANLKPMLFRYPQIPIGEYATSVVSTGVRESIIAQVKEQLADKPQLEAVNALLQLIQSGFDYATDDEQFGFEKPFFFEELLLYPQCDCEDRSLFYTYLLHNALGVESHMLGFPGHESVAVTLGAPISGDGYKYDGKQYYFSDPTYIGAVTGMIMSQYRNVNAEIDYEWVNE